MHIDIFIKSDIFIEIIHIITRIYFNAIFNQINITLWEWVFIQTRVVHNTTMTLIIEAELEVNLYKNE